MAKIAILNNARLKQFQNAPGQSIAVDIEHHGTDNAEFYQLPGFHGRPQDGAECVVIDCNGNNIVIASHDYKFDTEIQKGETLIFSYDANGVIKGKILIGQDGKISLSNESKNFKILFDKLIDNIKDIITTGSPTTHTINAATQAKFDALKTEFAELIKE